MTSHPGKQRPPTAAQPVASAVVDRRGGVERNPVRTGARHRPSRYGARGKQVQPIWAGEHDKIAPGDG